MENGLTLPIRRGAAAATLCCLAVAPLHAQETKPAFIVRPATPQEMAGVWELRDVGGNAFAGYKAIMADGRCGELHLANPPFGEPYTYTSGDVIRQIDREFEQGSPNGWHPCSLEPGSLTEASPDQTGKIYLGMQIVAPDAGNAESWPRPGARFGDIHVQQYYKFEHNPPPSVHVLTPAPFVMRWVAD